MEKLNCKSLMIGDWVVNTEFGRSIIDTIGTIEPTRVWLDNGKSYAPIEYIEPILLTPELVEKLGFEHMDECKYVFYTDDEDIIIDLFEPDSEDFEIRYKNKEEYNQDVGVRLQQCSFMFAQTACLVIRANYLHELQHALKICGINKEIVL